MSSFNPREYWENRLTRNWGLDGVGCTGYGKFYNGWLYEIRKRVFNQLISSLELDVEDLKVLDVGSGTGFYLGLWKALGAKVVVGSDITSIAVSRLKESYPELLIRQIDVGMPLEGRGLGEGDLDVITAFDVLFHIVEEDAFRQAFVNVRRLLKPEGYLIFSDNFPHQRTAKHVHQVSRSIDEIESILQKEGFRIIKRVPMFVLMNCPIDTKRRIWSFLWRVVMAPVRLINALGFAYGAVLYPIERCLVAVLKESPTTEVMICQKMSQL